MPTFPHLKYLSKATESILHSPFEWCYVEGGIVILETATRDGGTKGGIYQVSEFAIAKHPITNAHYERFLQNSNGFSNPRWWEYSSEAIQWRKDHNTPKPTAFNGSDLPRTRASWFDCMAFCQWLSVELNGNIQCEELFRTQPMYVCNIRLPTEQEWQRAALGDTGWCFPWGDQLNHTYANYGNKFGQPNNVKKFSKGKSFYGVMNMVGNVWEWCLTGWNQESVDLSGYTYRVIKGGAWNINNPDCLRANDRGCHPPRGILNDCGFRVLLCPG